MQAFTSPSNQQTGGRNLEFEVINTQTPAGYASVPDLPPSRRVHLSASASRVCEQLREVEADDETGNEQSLRLPPRSSEEM